MAYTPDQEILDRYARVLVDFALGDGKGIRRGDVVRLTTGEAAKPLYRALRAQILRSGGHVLGNYLPDGLARERYELSSLDQLSHFPRRFYRGLAETIDHSILIIAETDLRELEGIEPQKLMAGTKAVKPYLDWLHKKENAGRFTWTVALYGTSAMAREAKMSLRDYWEQIIAACFLDEDDPVAHWREVCREIERIRRKLNRLEIDSLHVESEGTDLTVGLGADRAWLWGGGRNIPSFELFTSPDWRRTEGSVCFSEPLYYYGSVIEGVRLRFERGEVVEASARRGEALLREMIATDAGAKRVGEFSLTDGRLSRITRFMAETLYDENRGGPEGNFHLALGSAYYDAYSGDPATLRKSDWRRLGYNDSAVHTDIVSTLPRTVTATLPSGRTKVIYRDGRFMPRSSS